MRFTRTIAITATIPIFTLLPLASPASTVAQDATPTMTYGCESAAEASPMAGHGTMALGTPAAEAGHDMAGESVEFDQLYIDMMIPHHQGIIALAQTAEEQLTDSRLQGIAEAIITAQQAENEELRGYREQWYGSPDSMPMDASMMDLMAEQMLGLGDMDAMMTQMDPRALVAEFCAADNPDLAFIDLSIPHHEMAITASEAALERATHAEIRTIAERVIADQQREIDELRAIRDELAGTATPTA